MIRGVTGWSLKFSALVIALAVGLMIFGVSRFDDAPVDKLPEFGPPMVEIQTEALGLSAAEVEQFITVPMEADLLAGVAWLDILRSESVPGLSRIQLIFEEGTDELRARQMVQERLTQAHALPNVSKSPQMLNPRSSTSRIMMIGLSSKDLSLIEMSVLARWTIRPRLMGVEGVANVSIFGQRERQLQVLADQARMRDLRVSLFEVVETAANALWVSPLTFAESSTPGTGGFIDTPNQRLGIRHISPITNADTLSKVTIQDKPGIRLSDVTNVVENHQPLIGDAITGSGPGLLIVIEKFPEADSLGVTREIDEALAELKPGLKGIEIDASLFRPATAIEKGMNNLGIAVIISLVLVVIVMGGLLYDLRGAFIGALSIVVSLTMAGSLLLLTGATFNIMVLAGLVIAVAVVVDEAIFGTESMLRRLRARNGSGEPVSDTILAASIDMRSSVVYATVIILLTTAPVFLLHGTSGEFFPAIGLSYALAVLASMVTALTITPALGLVLLSKVVPSGNGSPLMRRLDEGYGVALSRILRSPRLVYLAVGVMVIAGAGVLAGSEQPSLVPALKERDLLIRWAGAPGTSHTEMARITEKAAQELRSIAGVRKVGAHLGRAVLSDQVVGINSSEIWVSIDPDADYGATVASINEVIGGYPGLESSLLSYPDLRVKEILTGAKDDLVVRIFGEDLGVLRAKAEDVRQVLSGMKGVVEPRVEAMPEEPSFEVEVDLVAAQRYGVKPGDVRRAAAAIVNGVEVGSLFEDQKVYEVVVWSPPEARLGLNSIQDILIDTPSLVPVRLGDVAQVRVAPNLSVVRRESVSRRIDVRANVSGRSVSSAAREVERGLRGIDFPLEYHAEVLGDYAERQGNRNRMITYGIAAAIGVFLLLQAAFSSWRLAMITFLALPLALVGGLVGAFAVGGDISIGSYAGFAALLAIAVRNAITLLNHYQHLEHDSQEAPTAELITRGARERLPPVLGTTLVTAVALLPLLLYGDVFGHEVLRPLAVVILGGLVSSTLLSLFILPSLYLHIALSHEPARTQTPFSIGQSQVEPTVGGS